MLDLLQANNDSYLCKSWAFFLVNFFLNYYFQDLYEYFSFKFVLFCSIFIQISVLILDLFQFNTINMLSVSFYITIVELFKFIFFSSFNVDLMCSTVNFKIFWNEMIWKWFRKDWSLWRYELFLVNLWSLEEQKVDPPASLNNISPPRRLFRDNSQNACISYK